MRHFAVALVAGLAFTACSGSATPPVSPTTATPTLASITGTWSGSSADTTGSEAMTWTVTQDGGNVTGTMGFSDTGRGMMGNGSLRGTLNGRTVTFHMDVPNGGFIGMMSSCAMTADGQAEVSDDGHTLTGTYSGDLSGMMSGGMMNQSCGGVMGSGHFTLTR